MNDIKKHLILNLPDTNELIIHRSWAGTFGTAEYKKNYTRGRFLPIWLLYATSAMLNNNKNFKLIDAQTKNYDNQKTISTIQNYKPDYIFTMPCIPSYDNDLKILKTIKDNNPKIKIILIGGVVTAIYEKILNDIDVDFLINGRYPYYQNITNFLKDKTESKDLIYKKDGEIVKNPNSKIVNDLNKINLKSYEYLDMYKYQMKGYENSSIIKWMPILTGVGCPYNCSYCAYPIAYGKKIFYKDIDLVIKEIEHIIKNFNIKGFCMRDVVFTRDKARVKDFCKKVLEKKLDIKFLFETRVDLVDKQILTNLKQAGCYQINFGVESGSDKILKNVGKPGVNASLLKNSFNISKEAGISTMAHIILGLPGENKKTINETYNLLKMINADGVNINFITPYPGTKIYEYAKSNNLIVEKNWSNYTSHNIVMRSKELSTEDLRKMGKKIDRKLMFHKLFTDKKFRKYWLKKYMKYIWKGKILRKPLNPEV